MISSRRNFLIGATASMITAPAIVRAASLMPVKAAPVFEQARFLGYDIVFGRSPCMVGLPTLVELQAAVARRWDERLIEYTGVRRAYGLSGA